MKHVHAVPGSPRPSPSVYVYCEWLKGWEEHPCMYTRVCVCIAQWLDSKLSVIILSSSCLITPLSVLICTIYGAHCFPKMANTTRWVGETTLVLKTHLWELSRVVKTELTQLSCNSSQHTCYQSGASCPWIVAGQLAVMSKKNVHKDIQTMVTELVLGLFV